MLSAHSNNNDSTMPNALQTTERIEILRKRMVETLAVDAEAKVLTRNSHQKYYTKCIEKLNTQRKI